MHVLKFFINLKEELISDFVFIHCAVLLTKVIPTYSYENAFYNNNEYP